MPGLGHTQALGTAQLSVSNDPESALKHRNYNSQLSYNPKDNLVSKLSANKGSSQNVGDHTEDKSAPTSLNRRRP